VGEKLLEGFQAPRRSSYANDEVGTARRTLEHRTSSSVSTGDRR